MPACLSTHEPEFGTWVIGLFHRNNKQRELQHIPSWCLQSPSVRRHCLLVFPQIEFFQCILCFFTSVVPVLHKRWHGIQAYTSLSVKMVLRQSEWVFTGAEGQVSWTSCGLYLPSQWTWPSCPHKNPTDSIRHSCLHPLYPFRTSFSS